MSMVLKQFMRWLLCLIIALNFKQAIGAMVGFNYGTQMSVVPSPSQVVNLLKLQHINSIRLYDANASVLQALAGTGIQVSLTIANTELLSIGESNSSAANWVRANVLAYPNTNITAIIVGNEVMTSIPNAALVLVPAMKNLYLALIAAKLQNQVKISTTVSTSLILDSFPPSQAFFNKSWNSVLQPLLTFLQQTGSYLMLNVYSYDIYKASNGIMTLDYALLNSLPPGSEVVDSNTLLSYTNLFEAVLDSAYFALAELNFSGLPLAVSETGWPWRAPDSSSNDSDATTDNASTYNSNLIRNIVSNTGTPKYRKAVINTFILALFDEDLPNMPMARRHYGLFNASNMLPLYLLKLTGSGQLLSNDTTNQLYCVTKPGVDDDTLQVALDWTCGIGRTNCSAIQPGNGCYEPDTVPNHASYAFNAYYQNNGRSDGSCNFNGAAIITTTNPSYGSCVYAASFANGSTFSVNMRNPPGSRGSSSLNSTYATNVTVGTNSTSSALPAYASMPMSSGHFYTALLALSLVMLVVSAL